MKKKTVDREGFGYLVFLTDQRSGKTISLRWGEGGGGSDPASVAIMFSTNSNG